MSDNIQFKSLTPLCPAKDIKCAISFYEQKLGFKATNYGSVSRGNVEIFFYQTDDLNLGQWTSFRIQVGSIQSLYQEYEQQRIIHPNGALQTTPWGAKEFSILDQDGVCLTFFEYF